MTKELKVGNIQLTLTIWDTAGQERYRSLAPIYYRGAHAALIVYDITVPNSLQKAKDWLRELKINHNSPNTLQITLVGNKLDLDSARSIPRSVII